MPEKLLREHQVRPQFLRADVRARSISGCSVGDASAGERATRGAAVESEDVAKPVCVAELVLLTVP